MHHQLDGHSHLLRVRVRVRVRSECTINWKGPAIFLSSSDGTMKNGKPGSHLDKRSWKVAYGIG